MMKIRLTQDIAWFDAELIAPGNVVCFSDGDSENNVTVLVTSELNEDNFAGIVLESNSPESEVGKTYYSWTYCYDTCEFWSQYEGKVEINYKR